MINNKTITFETKCYENDWEFILKGNYLKKMIDRCGISFDKKQLIINNVKNPELVISYAKQKVKESVIDCFYICEATEEQVLQYFKTPKDSFGIGYVYSISELTGIFHCTTDYLLHFSSDSFPCKNVKYSNWVSDFINENQKNKDFITSSLIWNNQKKEVINESNGSIGSFFICQGFSDQCYLIDINVFKKTIYNEKNSYSERYPKYGGELFEKRCDAFMRNNNKYRLVHKQCSYRHANFPKTGIKRYISLFLCKTEIFTFCLIGREPNSFSIFINNLFKKLKNIMILHKKWKSNKCKTTR